MSPGRRAVQRTALVLAALCGVWMLVLVGLGGFDGTLLGLSITTHEPMRPLFAGALFISIYLLAGGAIWLPEPRQAGVLRRLGVAVCLLAAAFAAAWTVWTVVTCDPVVAGPGGRWRFVPLGAVAGVLAFLVNGVRRSSEWLTARAGRTDPRVAVGVLAILVVAIGVNWNTYAAGGSDSYGYLSEVPLWLRGDAVVAQPWATQVPWPDGIGSFSPLGYRSRGPDAIVPTYPAGLPFLMAAAQVVAGPCAVFWVTPVCGGVIVVFTWLLGRRLGSSRAGVMAAWLVATSAPLLFMLVTPLTDVPIAAVWTVAWFLLIGPGPGSAFGAGLAAGLASLIRPNTAPFAALFVGWKLWSAWRGGADGRGRRIAALVAVGAGLAPGAIAMAAINQWLYGSPILTGYGPAASYYAWANIPANVRNYWSWFLQAETPLGVLGLAALVLPLRRIWSGVAHRGVIVMAALFVVGLWAQYQAFLVFDAWWYIRFLLPCWPFILIGLSRVLELGMPPGRPIAAAGVLALVIVLGLRGVGAAADQTSTLDAWRGDHKYVTVGQLVGASTPDNSVVLSMQHSGSIRYYGGRMTLRYEYMYAPRVDADMAWLASHGAHPYALLDDWEADLLRTQYAGTATGARLREPPLVEYDGPSKTFLYDLAPGPSERPPTRVYVEDYRNARCVPPAPLPTLVFK